MTKRKQQKPKDLRKLVPVFKKALDCMYDHPDIRKRKKSFTPIDAAYQLLHWMYDGKNVRLDWEDVDELLQFIKVAERRYYKK